MILFTILLIALVLLGVIISTCAALLGTSIVAVFGDAIVCIAIIILIIKFIKNGV